MTRLKNKWKWIKTSAVLLATFNAGFNMGLVGPTLPDVQILTSSTTAQISTTMIWMGIASVIGAVFIGSLFDRFDGLLVISGCLLFQALAFSAATLPSILPGYQMILSVGFFFNIGLLTGTMSLNIEIWRGVEGMREPILQATDLVHSLGTAITPLAIASFLGKSTPALTGTSSPLSNLNESSKISFVMNEDNDDKSEARNGWFLNLKPVQLAYMVTGLFDFVVAVFCLLTFLSDRLHASYLIYVKNRSRVERIRYYSMSNSKTQDEVRVVRVRKTSDILFCKKSRRDYINERKKMKKNKRDLEGEVILEVEIASRNEDFKSKKVVLRESFMKELHERRESLRTEQISNALEKMQENKLEVTGGSQGPVISGLGDDVPQLECSWQVVIFAMMVLLLFITNGGRDSMLIGLLYTYACSYLGWAALEGAALVTTYHFTRTFIHFFFVYLVHRASSIIISTFNILVLLLASLIMLATSTLSSMPLIYFCVILTAVATSNTHPTTITFVQTNVQVTGRVMGALYAAISAGQIVYAPLLGVFLQYKGSIAFPSLLFITSILTAFFFLFSVLTAKGVKKYFEEKLLKRLEIKRQKNEKKFNENSPLIF